VREVSALRERSDCCTDIGSKMLLAFNSLIILPPLLSPSPLATLSVFCLFLPTPLLLHPLSHPPLSLILLIYPSYPPLPFLLLFLYSSSSSSSSSSPFPHFLSGTLSFALNGKDLGIAASGLASRVPLYASFSLYNEDDQLSVVISR
jgi:hypothetical protein